MIVPTVALGIVVVPFLRCSEQEYDIRRKRFRPMWQKWPRFERLYYFWEGECLDRVKKSFSSQQQTEAHATLMLKVFAVQVRNRTRACV